MSQYRLPKINDLLKREISDIILRGLKDPRIGFVTITRVRVSQDLQQAKVYFSVYSQLSDPKKSMEGLTHAANFIRTELNKRVRLRTIPKLHFFLDDSLDYAEHIENLIKKTKE